MTNGESGCIMRTITSNGGNLGWSASPGFNDRRRPAWWNWRLAVLAVFTAGLASYLGVTVAGAAHPPLERAPATTISSTPPGWVVTPEGVQAGTIACYNNVCYAVDLKGHPYGSPVGK